jgi:hypothetical protein
LPPSRLLLFAESATILPFGCHLHGFDLLAERLPHPVVHRPAVPAGLPTGRKFLAGIAGRLSLEGPDAAFTARVVLEELNATGRVITPARFAHLVAADLRPLLCARRAPVTATETNPAPRRVIRVTPAPVRPATTPPVASPVPRLINTA